MTGFFIVRYFPNETPSTSFNGAKVFVPYPSNGLVGVSTFGPMPGGLDGVVDAMKGGLVDNVAMIGGPSSNQGVELEDEVSGCDGFVGFDDLANLPQEGVDLLLGRGNQQYAVVLPNRLAKKFEAFLNMSDAGLLLGES